MIQLLRRLLLKKRVRREEGRRKTKYREGVRPDLGGSYFRSSWEANIARYWNYKGVEWEYEQEAFRIDDPVYPHIRGYLPDFKVNFSKDTDYYVEVKGFMDRNSLVKINYFKKNYCGVGRRLLVIGKASYKKIERLYSHKIPEWEY